MKYLFQILAFIIIIFSSSLFAQNQSEGLKRQGLLLMQDERYGEAIDQFNKFISANPRLAEGYNLRGLCYEKRQGYQYAVLDFRRAHKLDPSNIDIKKNLDRAIKIWHELLYKRIEGYKREIAIDPSVPFNYLEIGKAYRWLEEWALAEQWYDEYLARYDDASPDDLIRYTEILAKTGSIKKGERILKKFVDIYPEDWRLWSRYGYFTMWLGNYANARNAFETSLSFKPFFKEAEDGLDLAKQQGYLTQYVPRAFEKVYPIDRYYRVLQNNPNDDGTRFQLIQELIDADRYEEAYQQIQYLAPNYEGTDRYEQLWEKISSYRTNKYNSKIEEYQTLLKNFPEDREAVRKIAENYSYLNKYDEAEEVLREYLDLVPVDTDIRFLYAKILTYDRRYEDAYKQIKQVLEEDNSNIDYKFLAGQLAVWLDVDPERAEIYLTEAVVANPDNIDGYISLGTLNFQNEHYEAAKLYADQAAKIDANNPDLLQLYSMLELQELRNEQDRLLGELEKGQKLAEDEKCEEALPYYKEYIDNITPTKQILKEYAQVNICADRYDDALNIYDSLLEREYSYDIAKERAKVFYWNSDSSRALDEFKKLAQEDSSDIEVQIYLADSYAKFKEYEKAREIYLKVEDDAPEEFDIEKRLDWLPPGPDAYKGLSGVWRNFKSYFFSYGIVSPLGYYFHDNLNFDYLYGGFGLEVGLFKNLSGGGTWIRGNISNSNNSVRYTSLKGSLFYRPSENISVGLSYGKVNSPGFIDQPLYEATFNYTKKMEKQSYKISGIYTGTDAAFVVYSPSLVENRIFGHSARIDAEYKLYNGLYLSGFYQLIYTEKATVNYNGATQNLTDNIGNNMQIRVGKAFYEDLTIGYEYYFTDYKYSVPLYYSPQDYNAHSLWGIWQVAKNDELEFEIGGKVGYVPANDYIIRELNFKSLYTIYNSLKIGANGYIGNTIRNEVGYSSGAIYLNAYWIIY